MQAHPLVTLHPSFQGPTVSKKSFPVHSTSDMLIQCVINEQKEQVKINAVAERKSPQQGQRLLNIVTCVKENPIKQEVHKYPTES
jgi:hypothetical protein